MSDTASTVPKTATPSPKPRRSWDSLTFSERHITDALLGSTAFGRDVTQNSGTDRDFTLWLFDASTAFADLVGEFPQDLADGIWRTWYADDVSPGVAARVALHRKPMALIGCDNLVCPVCTTAGQIFERDKAIRYNTLTVQDGVVFGTAEAADFVHDHYACDHCGTRVRLPRGVEDYS